MIASETSNEPPQPSRLLKNRNIAGSFPLCRDAATRLENAYAHSGRQEARYPGPCTSMHDVRRVSGVETGGVFLQDIPD